jgi:hypothetical protein
MRDPQAGGAAVIVPLPGKIDCTNQERAYDQLVRWPRMFTGSVTPL